MERSRFLLVLVPLLFVFSACAPQMLATETAQQLSDQELALEVLSGFLTDLHRGRYSKAVSLYAGTYETMIDHNPSIDPQDRAALLRNACTINGAQCLEVRTAGLDSQISEAEFLFKVEFQTVDGAPFVLGPCCGASQTEQPPITVFLLRVVKNDAGQFQVMDMPPYAP